MQLNYRWPIEEEWNHHEVSSVLLEPEISQSWDQLKSAFSSISWENILDKYERDYSHSSKSISKSLYESLHVAITNRGGRYKVPIFSDEYFNGPPYIMEQQIGEIAIDFAFGHYNTIVWKLARLSTAVMPSKLNKKNSASLGVLILIDKELKKAGNFDAGVGVWQQAVDYLKPFEQQWAAPILLICIENPGNFMLVDQGRGSNPRAVVKRY